MTSSTIAWKNGKFVLWRLAILLSVVIVGGIAAKRISATSWGWTAGVLVCIPLAMAAVCSCRSIRLRQTKEPAPRGTFQNLIKAEEHYLRCGREGIHHKPDDLDEDLSVSQALDGESRVLYTRRDRVGLALSGGGIRSATFNLGVLQRLQHLDVLERVDYLSTVSGGGYIGGWWMAYRGRRKQPEEAGSNPNSGISTEDQLLEMQTEGKEAALPREPGSKLNASNYSDDPVLPIQTNGEEASEVRHLREFGNFLSPRLSFFESETWNAILAVITASLPSLLLSIALVTLTFLGWVALTIPVHGDSPLWIFGICVGVPLLVQIGFEKNWCATVKAEHRSFKTWCATLVSAFGLIITAICIFPPFESGSMGWTTLSQAIFTWAADGKLLHSEERLVVFDLEPSFFYPAVIWLAVTVGMFVPRLILLGTFSMTYAWRTHIAAIDRVLQRFLAAAAIYSLLGVLFLAGAKMSPPKIALLAGAVLGAAWFFILGRNWIGKQFGKNAEGGKGKQSRPWALKLIATVAVVSGVVLVATAIISIHASKILTLPEIAVICAAFLTFAVLFFDPAEVSFHSFYRGRIARAYLGASYPNIPVPADEATCGRSRLPADTNRHTDMRASDDIAMADWAGSYEAWESDALAGKINVSKAPPIHLVCCTANDICGDHLATLSRGGRSAVMSHLGISVGDAWQRWSPFHGKEVTLGSALTASAAAFNSNMGSVTMQLGGAVTFLLSALNLRLGLWVPHPAGEKNDPPLLPGLLFLQEMLGRTECGVQHAPRVPSKTSTALPKPFRRFVHLSDGGHFENMALYELVRRHCRYVIVSDCGSESFADFEIAVRRIREDFGVEVEIDLEPLKVGPDKLSRQHAAVGTIHYDPNTGSDTGILLYFKPSITGDEPYDVAEYRLRNQAFPHESTGDQFYDEAQWECYRRLGEHTVGASLRFIERTRRWQELETDVIFAQARDELAPTPIGLDANLMEVTKRLTDFEEALRIQAPKAFVAELFPELAFADKSAKAAEWSSVDYGRSLHFLIQMIQLMEDVWVSCFLETHASHPLNRGWENVFRRWAYAASFQMWWPILRPMYGPRFTRFVEELCQFDQIRFARKTELIETENTLPEGLTKDYWMRMRDDKQDLTNKLIFSYNLSLRHRDPQETFEVQVGLAIIEIDGHKRTAKWDSYELFIHPALRKTGIGDDFLCAMLDTIREKPNVDTCCVTLEQAQLTSKPSVFGTTKTRGRRGFFRPRNRAEQHEAKFDNVLDYTDEASKPRSDLVSRSRRNDIIAFYKKSGFIWSGTHMEMDVRSPRLQCVWRRDLPGISGDYNSRFWSGIAEISFAENTAGGAPKQATFVRVAWDDKEMRVIFNVEDSLPWATIQSNDADLFSEEVVDFFVDPTRLLQSYFQFEVNPNNALLDLKVSFTDDPSAAAARPSESARRQPDYDRGWHCRGFRSVVVTRPQQGWTVELSIPFAGLEVTPPEVNDLWRVNFARIDRPSKSNSSDRELSAWAPTLSPSFHVPAKFGFVRFVK